MKKLTHILLFALCLATLQVNAKNRVIQNPICELRTSPIFNVSKIESGKNETRVTILCVSPKGQWVMFSKNHFIQNSTTGEKLYPASMEGGRFDEKIILPESNDTTVTLIFPPLEKSVNQINFGEKEQTLLYGISLEKKKKNRAALPQEVPTNVVQWLNREVAKAKRQTLTDLHSPDFFCKDSARVVGYIRGYDPRLGFTTGMSYCKNEITNEDIPVVVQIHPDGRFEASLPMNHPSYEGVLFDRYWFHLYIEPGQTMAMIINWEETLSRKSCLEYPLYKFRDTQFMGPAAQINKDLLAVTLKQYPKSIRKKIENTTPAQFREEYKLFQEECKNDLENQLRKQKLTPQAESILRNELMISDAINLLDFDDNRMMASMLGKTFEPLKTPIPLSYFDFLREIPLNDQALLISFQANVLLNRLEYCSPMKQATMKMNALIDASSVPQKSFEKYLFEELGLKPSEEDKRYHSMGDSLAIYSTVKSLINKREAFQKDWMTRSGAFHQKYKNKFEGYKKKYLDVLKPMTQVESALGEWKMKDSILTQELKVQPNLMHQITKIRSLKFNLSEYIKNKEEARVFLTELDKGIAYPFLIDEGERLFSTIYPSQAKTAYELPAGKGTEVLRKIIDPFKGKTVFIDFWATSCGPCRGGIIKHKAIREEYKENPKVSFVFITSEDESPLEGYNKFVKEQGMTNSYRLNSDDYRYLRQLFKFNGIPRYVVVDKEGKVANDDYEMGNIEVDINKFTTQ